MKQQDNQHWQTLFLEILAIPHIRNAFNPVKTEGNSCWTEKLGASFIYQEGRHGSESDPPKLFMVSGSRQFEDMVHQLDVCFCMRWILALKCLFLLTVL